VADQIPVPDAGAPVLLDTMIRVQLAVDESLSMRLYVNDFTPGYGTVLASFVEATFGGYSRRTLDRSFWAPAVTQLNHVTTIDLVNGAQLYTVAAPVQTVFGIYLVGLLTTKVYFARRFDPPRVLVVGQQLRVSPRITLRSEILPGP
jgi:hypothetical protein